jgi:protoheme IX farnesyltransferase
MTLPTRVLHPGFHTGFHNCTYASDSARADFKDFVTLLKPGVMSLVVFSSLCGVLLAPGELHPFLILIATLCVALASGAAGAINMWYDRDIDALMKRTARRPIPMGKIAPQDALTFGVVLAVLSTLLMMLATNVVAGLLLGLSIVFYVFIYTMWLKRLTAQNIVIGGAAGALPPMIGWAAVTGHICWESFILFLIIFLWTPPHFWALALYQIEDYGRVQIPMLPNVKGVHATCKQIFFYTLLLVVSTYLPLFLPHFLGWIYGLAASVLGGIFLWGAIDVWRTQEVKKALKLFWYSIFYLFMLFTAMIIDHYARMV